MLDRICIAGVLSVRRDLGVEVVNEAKSLPPVTLRRVDGNVGAPFRDAAGRRRARPGKGRGAAGRAMERARRADAILFGDGPAGIRYPDGREIAAARSAQGSTSTPGRPLRAVPGIRRWQTRARRRSTSSSCARATEGLFARVARRTIATTGWRPRPRVTRAATERVGGLRLRLAGSDGAETGADRHLRRQGQRASSSMAFFRRVFDEVAARHPDIARRTHVRRCGGAQSRAPALGLRRAGRRRTCSATSCPTSAPR